MLHFTFEAAKRKEAEGLADVELLNWLAANASVHFNAALGMLEISVRAPASVGDQDDIRVALRGAMTKARVEREPLNSLFAVKTCSDEREAA